MLPSINDLNQTDRVLHSLAQLIALTGTNQLAAQPDDSQANMMWNSEQTRLEGQPFEYISQRIRLVIDLPTFSLQFLDANDNLLATFGVENKTPIETTAWWQTVIHDWGFNPTKPLNYQLDTAPIPLETQYTHPAGLNTWADWRTVANQTLARLNKISGQTSSIRIWPHHFDTGIYYSIADELGQERAAIWAGYAIADRVSPEPYFYLSGYNRQHPIDFSKAIKLSTGYWLAGAEWQGACLPVSQIIEPEQITRFLTESYTWLAINATFTTAITPNGGIDA
ncbi:hypothetical protein [Spirosoma jeollabukense]